MEAEPELPTTFGKYYLTEKLATGGMAEIYLAKIIGPGGFEKPLVIKQILPKLSGQRHFVDLFVAEAKILVGLTHGNIVPVYELGVVDETYFIAMEYIDGPTLYRLTETMARREAKMEPDVAAWITARILEGLDYAHRKGEGVIHRDLSPRNVMLSRDGDVKLVDFGIAVTLGEPGDASASESAPTGSFPYMSPEQVRREPLTPQTDLFSVGVLCWEMLVGERLFHRGDADATLAAVQHAEIPRPSSRRPEVPAKLDELVMRALERDRTARWADAGEMLAALQRYLYALEATPTPRDVASLVGKFCPLETRRLPTHLEALAHDVLEPLPDEPPPPSAGPRTAVIPRDGAAPRGKRPQRHKTFATHVDLQDMLAAIVPAEAATAPSVPVPGRAPPSRALLIVVGAGALALAGAAIYVFFTGRAAVLRADAPPPPTEAAVIVPLVDAAVGAAIDAPDAALAVDAGRRDAATRARPDAVIPMIAIDAALATATLRAGANPWGEVFVDGKHVGRAPGEFRVAAGHHAIAIEFPGEATKSFTMDLAADETKSVFADFLGSH